MGDLIAIPRPSADVDVPGVCSAIEAWADDVTDVAAIKDARARLSAIDTYIAQTSTTGRKTVAAAMLRLETRIGELIGAVSERERTDLNPALSVATDSLTKDERHDFREMAKHADVVEDVIANSTDANPPSRRKVLTEIKHTKQQAEFDAITAEAERLRPVLEAAAASTPDWACPTWVVTVRLEAIDEADVRLCLPDDAQIISMQQEVAAA